MSQSASSDPPRALGARDWVAPAPLAHPPHRSPARRWITAACLTLAILLAPVTQLVAWAEGTLLSTSGFVAALGTLPRDPAVQSQITAQLDRQLQRASRAHGTLASRLADITERQVVARAVPAIVSSPAFLRLWRTALNGAHSQLLLILRGRSYLLTITGSALTVNVPVAGRTLLNASGLPRQLGRLLPAATPVPVTVLNRPALGQARTAVRLTDTLSRILLPADLAGLAVARRRRRALLSVLIPVAALAIFGALGVHLLTHAASSPLATAATSALTAPLTGQLELTSALCAAAVALLLTAPRLVPRRDSGTSALTPRKRRSGS